MKKHKNIKLMLKILMMRSEKHKCRTGRRYTDDELNVQIDQAEKIVREHNRTSREGNL